MARYEFRPRPRKDPIELCEAAGWVGTEVLGKITVFHDADPEFADLRSPARARARTRNGEIGSYVAHVGVVIDAEQLSEKACVCSPGLMNWMFLPVENTAHLTEIQE